MFDPRSRYAGLPTYTLTDARGRAVDVVPTPPPPAQALLGEHVRKEGERADHLAARYLGDAAGYWRLAEMNDAMTADVLAQLQRVQVPARRG